MKQDFASLFLLIFIIPLTLLYSTVGKDYLIEGKNFLLAKDYINAENRLRKALDFGLSNSDSAICYFGLAICSSAQNDDMAMKDYFRKALTASSCFNPEASSMVAFIDNRIRQCFDEVRREMIGRLSVKSEPTGLEVFLDGVSVGKTPIILENILAKEHRLKISGKTRIIFVRADEVNTISFVATKPENVRSTKCFGIAVDNSSRYNLSYRNWLTDITTYEINLGSQGIGSQDISFILGIGYLRHIFPDYDTPRSLLLGMALDWDALSVYGETTDKQFRTLKIISLSGIIGSDYYFKRMPLSLSIKAYVKIFQFDAGTKESSYSLSPTFSFGLNLF